MKAIFERRWNDAKSNSEQGFALIVTIVILMILLNIIGGGLFVSGINLRTVSNHRTATIALQVADGGIQHALALIPIGTDFDSLLNGSVNGISCAGICDGINIKSTLVGSLPSIAGYSYAVVAEDDDDGTGPTDDANGRVVLVSTVSGPNSTRKMIRAYVGRSAGPWVPPGAVYIPGGSGSDAAFNTSGTFFITGKDTNYSSDVNLDGRADGVSAGPKASIYGVASNSDSMVTEFTNSLTNTEKTKVQGMGYKSPTPAATATPSVFATNTSFSVSELITNLKNQPAAVQYLSGLSRNASECPTPRPNPPPAACVFGTDAAPQITYIKEDSGAVRFDTGSTVTGSGVLIIEGKANLFGNFEFHGLVISLAPGPRGVESTDDQIKLKLKDNARIFGSVVLGPNDDQLKFDVKDNASMYYSSQALNLVQNNWGFLLPRPARLLAWAEVME